VSASLWHRFPARDLHAVRAALQALLDAGAPIVHTDEAAAIRALLDVVERGFAAKQDLELDLALLRRCLEFDVVTCDAARRDQLRAVLQRVRAHRSPAAGQGG
jgi:hypothetical protein